MFKKPDFDRLKSMAQIQTISPFDFEYFGKFFLESMGYTGAFVSEKRGALGGDGGIDITCVKGGKKTLVQCKKWRFGFRGSIPIAVIRELGGCMLRDKAPRGIVFSTLGFDTLCRNEALKMGIDLIGPAEILLHMQKIHPGFRSTESLWARLLRLLRMLLGLEKRYR